jgi:uncharacterized protein YbgA (DUF1722 family)/uncharacterized protein YbbK (DUF523 family)
VTEASASGGPPVRLGVSSCLLGERVRYDGGHKKDDFLTGLLARFVELVPVCPEVELGLGTPREPIRLQRDGDLVRLVAPKSGKDHTEPMRRFAERRVRALARLDLCGYVLKKDSPSCGMERVRVWGGRMPSREGRGAFACVLMAELPLLPVEEEGRLRDPALRESFVERVFAYRRLKDLFQGRWTVGDLVSFHAAEKLLVLAHEPAAYQRLGRLVAGAKGAPRAEIARAYAEVYMSALARPAPRGRHVNVLQHMAGYLKDLASADERQELAEAIEDYRRGLVPLVVPVTLVKHHVRRHGIAYLAGQRYLEPHPKELMLRNHA